MEKFIKKYGSITANVSAFDVFPLGEQLDFVNEETGFVVSINREKCGWLSFDSMYQVKRICKVNKCFRTDYYNTMEQALIGCQKEYDADINYFI
tara:strand:- start:171 stop:452 length:282 start_codon:yes stop_codon:yes gene_type:complete